MRTIRKYILKESIIPFCVALGILTCVFLLAHLIKLTNLVINKGVSIQTVGHVFLLYIPVLLGYTLPIACLVSVILTFSRFSTDNEIIALRASGIHLMRLLSPILIIGIMMSLFCVILNERVIPGSHHKQREILQNLGSENPTAFLEAGLFLKAFKGYVIFIHKIEDNRFYDIIIHQPQPDGPTRTIIARRGEFTPVPGEDKIKLKLINGTADEPNLEDPSQFFKVNFDTYFMTLDISNKKEKVEKKAKSMNFLELKNKIKEVEAFNAKKLEELNIEKESQGESAKKNKEIKELKKRSLADTAKLKTEYHRKITWSLSPLIFVLLGFPLAVITNRREKSANVVIAIIAAACYYLLSLGCQALAIESIVEPAIVMWIPNTITAIAALILNYRCVS